MPDQPTTPHPDEEWESLLRQLRQQPAQPRPFFYSRVRARLAGAAERPGLPGWLRWPGYALMLSTVVLLSGDGAGPGAGLASRPGPPGSGYPATPRPGH